MVISLSRVLHVSCGIIIFFLFILKNNIIIPKVVYFIFFIALIPVGQFFGGVIYNLGDALLVSMYIGFFLIVFICGYNVSRLNSEVKTKILTCFLLPFLISSIISVGLQLSQWLLLEGDIWVADLRENARPYANVAQPNLLSTLLIIGVLSIFYFYENKFLGKFSAGLSMAFIIFGIALTFSRTAWIFCVFFIIFYFLKKRCIKDKFNLSNLSFVSWVILFFTYLFFIPIISEKLGLLYRGDIYTRVSTGGERINIWVQLLEIIYNQPILGYGWNQLNIAQMSVEGIDLKYPIFGYSHNFILDILIWNGLFLGSILILTIFYFFVKLVLVVRFKNDLILLSMVGIIVLHSLLEYPFAYAYFLIPLSFLVSIIYGNYFFSQIKIKKPKIIVSIISVILVSLLFLTAYEYIRINPEFQSMRYEKAKLKSQELHQDKEEYLMVKSINDYIWFVRYPLKSNIPLDDLERAKNLAFSKPSRPVLMHYMKILILNNRLDEVEFVLNKYNSFYNAQLSLHDIESLVVKN
ncbi:O-antigen ligase C-terminal domain-containing protein [Acinetobacter schindleri]|uniref:O-antigen ligase family protein n=1 Tax=Acinetobacter schindleri TaxID=108981 RepID=UPI0023615A29|nr:O-antigen ligase family protein [Acinetobacter schindleri]WDE16286.1 O-antigen ligase C-terminal domain-containing protein [Acinetobacter schindleri]